MKILLTLFVLFFSSSVFAGDISDFQIEGMSVGDSALDYFSKSEIQNGTLIDYNDKKYYGKSIKINSDKYDWLQFHFLKGDDNYLIHAVGGMKDFKYNIEDCYSIMDEIVSDISGLFKTVKIGKKRKRPHMGDPSEKSKVTDIWFYFNNGAEGHVGCYDWSVERGHTDDLRVVLNSPELTYWLNNIAHQ